MNPEQYDIMAATEDKLWWYRGLRSAMIALVKRYSKNFDSQTVMLDAGCGTGANLRCLNEHFPNAILNGFDLNPTSLEHTRLKNPQLNVYESDICSPELNQEAYDLIVSMDVMCMIGVEDSLPGLKKMADALKPNGLFIINTPAMKWQFSEHDKAVHTIDRLNAKEMKDLGERMGLEVLQISYRCFYLFPLIILSRLPTMFGRAPETATAKSDTILPHPLINSIFTAVMNLENWALGLGISYPWGTSVTMVARKPAKSL